MNMARKWLLITAVVGVFVVLSTTTPLLAQTGGDESAGVTFGWWFIFDQSTNPYKSGWIGTLDMVLLYAGSIASVALIIQFFLAIRRTILVPELTVAQVKTMFDERRFREALEFCQNDPSLVASVVHAGLIEAANGYEAMERAISEAAEARATQLLRKVEWLNLLGNICPMLGLWGTVYGMIVCFGTIAAKGGTANPADLASGVMVALFSTFIGLVDAMPALSAYSILKSRIDELSIEASVVAEELLANFKPAGRAAQKQA